MSGIEDEDQGQEYGIFSGAMLVPGTAARGSAEPRVLLFADVL
jgi:hypothetical protein